MKFPLENTGKLKRNQGKGSIVQEAGWAPGPVWTGAENLAPPPRFDPRTVQHVASRYTEYATRPTYFTG